MSRGRMNSGLPIVGGPITSVVDLDATGLILKWDASGPFASRPLYNDRPKEFAYLATDTVPFTLYVKQAVNGIDADWSIGTPVGPVDVGKIAQFVSLINSIQTDPSAAGLLVTLLRVASIGRTAVADKAYSCVATDAYVAFTALTAPRTITLPTAASFRPAQPLYVADETGLCSDALTITVVPRPGDTISGQNGIIIASAYQKEVLHSNGGNLWTVA